MAELRFDVLTEPLRTGETVADVCRRYGISQDTYYRYRRRYLAEGLDGLEDQSRRPKTSPAQIPAEVEIRICEMRRDHPRWGARRIRAELDRAGVEAPAVSTIYQVLRRNGLVAPQPPRRPRADKRFEQDLLRLGRDLRRRSRGIGHGRPPSPPRRGDRPQRRKLPAQRQRKGGDGRRTDPIDAQFSTGRFRAVLDRR